MRSTGLHRPGSEAVDADAIGSPASPLRPGDLPCRPALGIVPMDERQDITLNEAAERSATERPAGCATAGHPPVRTDIARPPECERRPHPRPRGNRHTGRPETAAGPLRRSTRSRPGRVVFIAHPCANASETCSYAR